MNKYLSVDDIINNDHYPFTKGQMQNFLRNRSKNKLKIAIRKIGKRIYVREDLFIEWIESYKADPKIKELSFSVRTLNCLNQMNIETLSDLTLISEEELMKYRNFGLTCLKEIKRKLIDYNLKLKGDI